MLSSQSVGPSEKLDSKTEQELAVGRAVGSGFQAEGTARTKALRWEPASFIGSIRKLASVTQGECEEEMRLGTGRPDHPGPVGPRWVWGFILRMMGRCWTVL